MSGKYIEHRKQLVTGWYFLLPNVRTCRFRLLMFIPLLISSTMGWFGWAISAHLEQLWIGPAIFYSLINFGQAVGGIA